jgi:hypothetical protein
MHPSVVIHDFHVVGVALAPHEAHAPALIHADAVLPGAVGAKRLEAVPWRHPELIQRLGGVKLGSLRRATRYSSSGTARFLSRRNNLSVSRSRKLRITRPP